MRNNIRERILSVVTAILFIFVYFALGFAACAYVPQVTEELSKLNSADEISPFSKSELVELAVATRDYTVSDGEREDVLVAISKANKEAGTPYADASTADLLQAPAEYTLNENAFDHLDDVHAVISRVAMPLICLAALAVFCLMTLLNMFGIAPVGRALIGSGVCLLILFAIIGAWAAFGFNSLFTAIHSIFFESGSWTFPYDSLLICMYPLPFWLGMGAVWLGTSCLLSVISIAAGIVSLTRHNRQKPSEAETEPPTPMQSSAKPKQKPAKAHPEYLPEESTE